VPIEGLSKCNEQKLRKEKTQNWKWSRIQCMYITKQWWKGEEELTKNYTIASARRISRHTPSYDQQVRQ